MSLTIVDIIFIRNQIQSLHYFITALNFSLTTLLHRSCVCSVPNIALSSHWRHINVSLTEPPCHCLLYIFTGDPPQPSVGVKGTCVLIICPGGLTEPCHPGDQIHPHLRPVPLTLGSGSSCPISQPGKPLGRFFILSIR